MDIYNNITIKTLDKEHWTIDIRHIFVIKYTNISLRSFLLAGLRPLRPGAILSVSKLRQPDK